MRIVMDNIALQGILPFVHVVEAGSFTRAAERLHVTTSAVGKSVAQMEQRLGVRLINRTTRSLSVTSEGEAYYQACLSALSGLEAAQAQLASHREAPSGTMRVELPLAFGRRCVAPILFKVVQRYPALNFEISFNDRRINLIEEGIDLAIRLGNLEDSAGLMSRRLYTQRSGVVASPRYLAKHGRPRNIKELAGHDLVAYGRDGSIKAWQIKIGEGRVHKFTPQGRLVLGHGEPVLDAVLAGCGIAYMPTWLMADDLKAGRLELVFPHLLAETTSAHAVWAKARNPAPKIRAVIDALVEGFSAPVWDQV